MMTSFFQNGEEATLWYFMSFGAIPLEFGFRDLCSVTVIEMTVGRRLKPTESLADSPVMFIYIYIYIYIYIKPICR